MKELIPEHNESTQCVVERLCVVLEGLEDGEKVALVSRAFHIGIQCVGDEWHVVTGIIEMPQGVYADPKQAAVAAVDLDPHIRDASERGYAERDFGGGWSAVRDDEGFWELYDPEGIPVGGAPTEEELKEIMSDMEAGRSR